LHLRVREADRLQDARCRYQPADKYVIASGPWRGS
jgi:hypothetical protein